MIYSALNIYTNNVEEIFEGNKESEEYKKFTEKYPAAKGYCIASKKKS